jgi:hypothetical protein
MKYALAAACLALLTSASLPMAASAEPQTKTTPAKKADATAPEQPIAKELEAQDKLGNFEIQDLMGTYVEEPKPPPKPKPKAPPPKPQ